MYTLNINAPVAPVPEPETYALMGMGLAGLLAARRRKMKAAKQLQFSK
nr:PEP-CTERM sorting domain-containing protein [uncultured Deefgea sp.]